MSFAVKAVIPKPPINSRSRDAGKSLIDRLGRRQAVDQHHGPRAVAERCNDARTNTVIKANARKAARIAFSTRVAGTLLPH